VKFFIGGKKKWGIFEEILFPGLQTSASEMNGRLLIDTPVARA
jgi:hypothetical protein